MSNVKKEQSHELFKYKVQGKVSKAFHEECSFFRGLMGPIGSGKSVACCIEIFLKAQARPKGIDGVRRSRFVAVRNTGPELETTTIKTWLDWFGEDGKDRKLNRKPPITYSYKDGDLEFEVIFLALDRDEDMKKLLSLEATGIWLNEARFINKSILDAATGRVGRYPSRKEKPEDMTDEDWIPWYGIIADTNPPDDTHWWYTMAEEEKPKGFKFFKQPSGFSAEAENITNLPRGYYDTQLAGKSKEYIDVFLHGNYGFIQSGQPVYGKNFNDAIHISETEIKPLPQSIIYAGIDFGLTPAILFSDKTYDGQWRVFCEIATQKGETISIPQFARILKSYIDTNLAGRRIIIYGDPSGGFRDQQGVTAFEIFRNFGILIQAAPTNNFMPRKDAVIQTLNRLINGKAGIIFDKSCRLLRKGFNGAYKYRKLQISGDAKYTSEPDKNEYSHVHDCLQYMLCGGGEYRDLRASQKTGDSKTIITKSWKIF